MRDLKKQAVVVLICLLIFCLDFSESDNSYKVSSGEAREVLSFDKNVTKDDVTKDDVQEEKSDASLSEEVGLGLETSAQEKGTEKGTEKINSKRKAIPIGEPGGDVEEISNDFARGMHLIYYCKDKHWGCVDRASFDKCKMWRENAKNKREQNLKCVPIKSYQVESECIEKQKKGMVLGSDGVTDSFCTDTKGAF
ncbi:MAG: hypothetical protein HQK49_06975 [Oligoflexia bacterium]|nr:hypothetical protein [Oligoflexia bacterium]